MLGEHKYCMDIHIAHSPRKATAQCRLTAGPRYSSLP
jgi:hypothetical protein